MPSKNPHAVALGRKGGQSTSPRKAQAARQNGQTGQNSGVHKAKQTPTVLLSLKEQS